MQDFLILQKINLGGESGKKLATSKEVNGSTAVSTHVSKASQAMYLKWQNPSYRKHMSNLRKKLWKNPDYRKFMLKMSKRVSRTKSFKKFHSRKMKLQWQDGSLRETTKRTWNNEFFREKFKKARYIAMGARPNKLESYVAGLLGNSFTYCGDGVLLINKRNPDFVHKRKRIVVLVNGIYWHLKKFGLSNTRKNKLRRELIEAKPFNKAGYHVWFIWEDETNTVYKRGAKY